MASDVGFEQHSQPMWRDQFLKTMDALVQWSALCKEVVPYYPKEKGITKPTQAWPECLLNCSGFTRLNEETKRLLLTGVRSP